MPKEIHERVEIIAAFLHFKIVEADNTTIKTIMIINGAKTLRNRNLISNHFSRHY